MSALVSNISRFVLIENRPIDGLHTHSYGFHTANGRELINGIQNKYYEYENGNY